MALSDLETSTIERDQAEAVVNHLRAALRSVVDGPAGNPTIDVALRYSRDVATAALIREHGPRNAVASLARELRESRAENARLREALEEQTEAWQSIAHEIDVAGMSRRDLRDLAESLGDRARAALTR